MRTGWRNASAAHCAAACPADCIRVVAEENTADNRVSAGERYARIYEINSRAASSVATASSRARSTRSRWRTSSRSPSTPATTSSTRRTCCSPSRSSACPSPTETSTTRRSRLTRNGARWATSSSGWSGWSLPLACLVRCRGHHLHQPVLLGARANRQPRRARRPLPASRPSCRGGASARLCRRCMVMFLFVIATWGGGPTCREGGRAGRRSGRRLRQARCSWRSSSSSDRRRVTDCRTRPRLARIRRA